MTEHYMEREVVKENILQHLECDGCGILSDGNDFWSYEGGTAHGILSEERWIDGEELGESLDLCPACASALVKYVSWCRRDRLPLCGGVKP